MQRLKRVTREIKGPTIPGKVEQYGKKSGRVQGRGVGQERVIGSLGEVRPEDLVGITGISRAWLAISRSFLALGGMSSASLFCSSLQKGWTEGWMCGWMS